VIMAGVEEVEVVVAHHERATLRVGDAVRHRSPVGLLDILPASETVAG